MSEAIVTQRRRMTFSLRTMFVAFTIAAMLGGGISYPLNWIRQRRALAVEGETILELLGNYTTPVTSEDIAPIGTTLPQRLLALLGEPAASRVYVYYVLPDEDYLERYDWQPTDHPKVQRAQRLFPEAVIDAVSINWNDEIILDEVKGVLSD